MGTVRVNQGVKMEHILEEVRSYFNFQTFGDAFLKGQFPIGGSFCYNVRTSMILMGTCHFVLIIYQIISTFEF